MIGALGDRSGMARIQMNLGNLAQSQGDYGAAHTYFQDGLASFKELGDRSGIVVALTSLGNLALSRGDYGAARTYLQESLILSRELGDRLGIAENLGNLGTAAARQGDYEVAQTFYQDSLKLQKELGDLSGISKVLGNRGNLSRLQGDFAAARTYYQDSLAISKELGDLSGFVTTLLNLGNVAEEDGHGGLDAAEKYYSEARQLAASLSDRNNTLGEALWGLGRVAAKRGKKAEARQYVDQAIQILQPLGDPALQEAKQFRASLGSAPDPVQCRKTCDELQTKGELAVSVAECVKKLCAD